MMNHTRCLVDAGFKVNVVAYGTRSAAFSDSVNFIPLKQPKKLGGGRIVYLVNGISRALYQFTSVFLYCYLRLEKPQCIIIQNPPAIPTLLLARILSFFLNSPLIIDWHNFGFSIMEMERPKGSLLVKFAERYEKFLGSSAYAHLTVTQAMATELQLKWNVKGKLSTLYDKAPKHIKYLTPKQKISFLSRIQSVGSDIQILKSSPLASSTYTSFDFVSKSHTLRQNSPAIIVSSTSWTIDEDFSILLDALKLYDTAKHRETSLPTIHCIITGNGPLKSHYMSLASKLGLEHVSIFFGWLSSTDYPKLLSASALGISLHTSSSGLDLPMKVVDLFAAGTPVLALDFHCIDELVENGRNGHTFKNASDLSFHLKRLLRGDKELSGLRKGAREFRSEGWESNWNSILLPIIKGI